MRTHRAVVALLIVAVMAYGAPATAAAGDFHSRWVDQAAWPTLAPSATTSYTIRYRNTGTAAWVRGSAAQANLAVNGGRQAVEEAAEPLETRGIVVAERGRFRVRERTVLRYYARTIEHLLVTTGRTH